MSADSSQRSVTSAFGSSHQRCMAAIKPLLRTAVYIARKEMPLRSFIHLIELNVENGCKISTAYNNIEGCKAMVRILSSELTQRLISELKSVSGSTNFASWMIDGSTAAKKNLPMKKCVPKVQLLYIWDFISIKPYVTTDANNLFHVTLRVLFALFDPEL